MRPPSNHRVTRKILQVETAPRTVHDQTRESSDLVARSLGSERHAATVPTRIRGRSAVGWLSWAAKG